MLTLSKSDFLEKKSIFLQSRAKASETSDRQRMHSHEHLSDLNSWDIWHESIARRIDDEMSLTASTDRERTRNHWESRRKRDSWDRWRDRKLTRNVFASMCWCKCFEFDRFESKWDRCIKIWRNARLYEIKFAIVSVKSFRRQRAHLKSLQIKWFRLLNEHAKQIVHSEIEFLNVLMFRWRNTRRSERSKRAIDCWLLQDIVDRFWCCNRKTRELECNDWSWDDFCSRYRFAWCCNRREKKFWWDALWKFTYTFWCRDRER